MGISPSVRLPDFVVIGAAKAGTSTFFRYLDQHPHIFASQPKEPCYFDPHVAWGRGCEWYASLFRPARPEQLCGEASTNYTRWPQVDGVPERMHSLIPGAKLIYLMRDPIARSYSHFVHRWTREVHRGEPFSESFGEFVSHDRMCLDSSDYATQIARYLECFPRDRLLLLTFEALAKNPRATLNQVFRFLDVEDRSTRLDVSTRKNDSGQFLQDKLRDRLMAPYRSLPIVGPAARQLLPAAWKDWIYRRVRTSGSGRRVAEQHLPPPMTVEERRALVERFEPRNAVLRERYGVDTGAWSC